MMVKRDDLLAGGFFVVFGAGVALYSALTLNLGTPSRMGSGFFPVMLGVILAALGFAIMFRLGSDETADPTSDERRPLPLRAMLALTAAPVVFATTVRSFGLVAATLLCIAIVCLASTRMTWKLGLMVTLCLTALSVLIFSYGLRLPLPLLPPLVTG